MRDRICIVLLNANQKKDILETLCSLTQIDYALFTILVFDQASTDGSVAAIRSAFPKVPISESPMDLGVAGGNNLAVEWALTKPFKWILLLDNPSIAQPSLLKQLLHAAKEHPDTKIFKTGRAHFIHRTVFETIGLFDSRFRLFWDKADFCSRAIRKGFAIQHLKRFVESKAVPYTPEHHSLWWYGRLLWLKKNTPPPLLKMRFKTYVYPKIWAMIKKTTRPYLKSSFRGIFHYYFNSRQA